MDIMVWLLSVPPKISMLKAWYPGNGTTQGKLGYWTAAGIHCVP